MEKEKTCKDRINSYWKNTEYYLYHFLLANIEEKKKFLIKDYGYTEEDLYNNDVIEDKTRQCFSEYHLCIDFVEKDTFTDIDEDFIRYCMSTGGPGDEIRIFKDKIEYCFIDWYDFASIDVSNNRNVEALIDYYELYL